jgi:hypothetical protein
MRSKFDPSVEAKNTIIDLISNLKDDIFKDPEERGDLVLVEFYFKNINPERVMTHLINKVLPYRKQIESRNVKFFLENESLFAGLPEDKIKYYSGIIASGKRIRDDYRITIWEYFDTLIAFADLYQKNK